MNNSITEKKKVLIGTPVNININFNPHSFLDEFNPNANHFAANTAFGSLLMPQENELQIPHSDYNCIRTSDICLSRRRHHQEESSLARIYTNTSRVQPRNFGFSIMVCPTILQSVMDMGKGYKHPNILTSLIHHTTDVHTLFKSVPREP
jgi:hypothetical protein